jgi:uncharacterized protein (DUF1501 family)
MAITRRQFLKRSGLVAAGAALGPGLLDNVFVRRALAETIGDRYLVVLYLDGGNDGLGTVMPATNGGGGLRTAYEVARKTGTGGLQLAPGDVAGSLIGLDPNTGAQLAIHPGLVGFPGKPGYGGLKALYDLGKVAVVQGCGYPDYSLSHDTSTTVWETGNPLGVASYATTGWVGRWLAANYSGADIPGVTIGSEIAGELRQFTTSVLAVRNLRRFGFPFDDFDPGDAAAQRAAFLDLAAAASAGAQGTVEFIGNGGSATLLASESYPQLHSDYLADRGSWEQMYSDLGTSLSRDLREVAKVIYGVKRGVPNVAARCFQVRNGGYDTHSDQGAADPNGQHFGLHAEVGAALKVFYDDLADMGIADKLCVITWSEFSRRITQNDNGTDHGSQGPMFVIGGSVNGGVYGNHPNIDEIALDNQGNTPYSQDPADDFRSTDFRDVYGTVLKHWLNMPHATILSSVLALDPGDPTEYWTVENFELPIL